MANVGSIDRILRIVVGVVLLLMTPQIGGLLGQPIMGISSIWGWIGAIPLLTALVGVCPAYSILGLSTCKRA